MIGQAPSSPTGISPSQVVELVLAALLFLGGLRSLVFWLRTDFDADSGRERVLLAIYASARVGTWVAFAALFLGYAVVSEPQAIRWFAILPLALAGLQLLTGMKLSRPRGSPSSRPRGAPPGQGVSDGEAGKAPAMEAAEREPPGSLEPEKHGETADPGHPQPNAAG